MALTDAGRLVVQACRAVGGEYALARLMGVRVALVRALAAETTTPNEATVKALRAIVAEHQGEAA